MTDTAELLTRTRRSRSRLPRRRSRIVRWADRWTSRRFARRWAARFRRRAPIRARSSSGLPRPPTRDWSARAGPRYFGFVIGGSLPAALATDWLASSWDQNGFVYVVIPGRSRGRGGRRRRGSWSCSGCRRERAVGFVTGVTMANFTALAAARHSVLARAGWDVERDGLQGAPPVTVVTHEGTHATVYASLQMLGLGREGERVRRVAADDQGVCARTPFARSSQLSTDRSSSVARRAT